MEFQNQPFQDLKDRVATLEDAVVDAIEGFERRLRYLEAFENTWATKKPETVREEQDDA